MNTAKTLELLQSEAAYTRMCELYGAEKAEENIRRYGELVKKFRENIWRERYSYVQLTGKNGDQRKPY